MQECSRCGEFKEPEGFSPSYRGKNGTWCRSCFATYMRHRAAGTTPPAPTRQRPERVCDTCGQRFTPGLSKDNIRFCSRDCKDTGKNRRKAIALAESKPDRACVWCGAPLPKAMRADAKFCSADCNDKAHSRTRNFRRRMGPDAPERPRKEPLVRFIDIAVRDKWRCKLCGGKVDRERQHPDPLCASLDHIVPVSKGGTNEPSNLQLTHLRCNLSKGDGARGEQMLLL